MIYKILGLHHITAIAGDAQRNYNFYTKTLRLCLVKKTGKGRVKESVGILEKMNAKVSLTVYDGRPHTISQNEIEEANRVVFM